MKWGLVVSVLLPYVAATLSPYKRFVSHLKRDPNIVWKPNSTTSGTPSRWDHLGLLPRLVLR